MICESKLTHTYSYKQFLLYKLFLCLCVVVHMCVCKTYDYDHVKWHNWAVPSESEWPRDTKILPSGTLHKKKSLPTLVALNYSLMKATMTILFKLFYITKCYTRVWFELMRLVEIVIADVVSSKNNFKIFSNDIWKCMIYIHCCWKKGII